MRDHRGDGTAGELDRDIEMGLSREEEANGNAEGGKSTFRLEYNCEGNDNLRVDMRSKRQKYFCYCILFDSRICIKVYE